MIFVIGIAYGLTISVISIHLKDRAFAKESMGALASVFALGIVSLSLPSGWVNRKLTPKRTLVGSLLGYGICVLVFPLLKGFAAVAAVRFFDGAFSVGVWVSCETILLFHADRKHRAFVMSLYAMAIALGYVIGPVIANLLVAASGTSASFVAAAVLALIAATVAVLGLPLEEVSDDHGPIHDSEKPDAHASIDVGTDVAAGASTEARPHASPNTTTDVSPSATAHGGPAETRKVEETPLGTVLKRIRCSCFGTFAYGYFQASVVLFLRSSSSRTNTSRKSGRIYITAFFAAGMLLFSPLLARVGDRYGHLIVMRVLAAIGATTIATFVMVDAYWIMCVGVFIAGATLASISPVRLGAPRHGDATARSVTRECLLQRVLCRGDARRPAALEPDVLEDFGVVHDPPFLGPLSRIRGVRVDLRGRRSGAKARANEARRGCRHRPLELSRESLTRGRSAPH